MIDLKDISGFDSSHLCRNFRLLDPLAIGQFVNGLSWVYSNVPDSLLIGGAAVISWLESGRLLTPDIDFMVNDIGATTLLLNDSGIMFKPLRDGIGLMLEDYNIDLISSDRGNRAINKLAINKPLIQKIGGREFRVINPELLFIMKMELGREKDISDAMLLLQSGVLRKSRFLSFAEILSQDLNEYQSLRLYSEMMTD